MSIFFWTFIDTNRSKIIALPVAASSKQLPEGGNLKQMPLEKPTAPCHEKNIILFSMHMHTYETKCIPRSERSAAVYCCVHFNLEWTEPLYLDYRVYVGSNNKPNHYIALERKRTARNQHHRW